MAETYRKIYPGNCVTHLNSYALPGPDFKVNSRPASDPRDRTQQALMIMPGWLAVRKVGYSVIDTTANEWPVIVGSPDLRPDDKPRPDISGLLVPTGALLLRAALRVSPVSANPGYYSAGPRRDVRDQLSGVVGTAGDRIILATGAAAPVDSLGPAAVATAGDLVVDADGNLPVGVDVTQTNWGNAATVTADCVLRVFADGAGLSSTLTGGAYVVSEVVYVIREDVASIDDLHLPSANMNVLGR